MLRYILSVVVGYLCGSVSVAVLMTKRKYGTDVRTAGSGNAGATNVARVFGMKAGVLTLGGDMLKTAVSGLVGWLLCGYEGLAVACLGCIIGHCWPLYFNFKGGKGVSVGACIALLLDWRFFLLLVVWFFFWFLISRRVSVCSLLCALVYPWAFYLFHGHFDLPFAVCCVIGVMVIFLHRANIGRILRGEEAKFKPKSAQ